MTNRARVIATITALVLGGFAAVAPVSAALAHDPVMRSTPAAGDVLTQVPSVFSVSAAQPMLDLSGDATGFGLQVTDASGHYYGDGCLTVEGDTLSMPATLGAAGDYTLTYQYVSSDGHTLSDTIAFSFAPTDADTTPVGFDAPPVCGQAAPAPSSSPTAEGDPSPAPSSSASSTPAADESGTVLGIAGGIILALVVLGVVIALVARRGDRVEPADTGDELDP